MKSVLALVTLVLFGVASLPAQDKISFSRSILPIFSEKCLGCHGPDKAEGGLRLHHSESALRELDSGDHAIVPHDAKAGSLMQRIETTDLGERMPPEGDPLSQEQIELIRSWINQGAKFDAHWSYLPVKKPQLPKVHDHGWIKNEVDHFVISQMTARNLKPSPVASKATLVKRLHYDLIGLPPTIEAVDRFVNTNDASSYENLVDELLASKHFGEKWGRHWLDLARYADSDGYEKDRPRMNAWRYRDWVINAINRDLSYDRFSIEQIAGDLIANATPEQKLATAFHRQTLTNTEGGTDQEQFRVEATFDRTETTAAIWMGLTLTCARCHTHKYDQITQTEYFQLYSFFNSANETTTAVPASKQAVAEYQSALAEHQKQLETLEQRLAAAKESLQPKVKNFMAIQRAKLQSRQPLQFHATSLLSAKTSSGAKIEFDSQGLVRVSGKTPDKDKYTVVIRSPKSLLTGLRVTLLTDPALPKTGPGRAQNGNFVLSQVRVYVSDEPDFKKFERIDLVAAEVDFAQRDFSAKGALSDTQKSGWAISPQMGKPHQITIYLGSAIQLEKSYLQVVLDQSYGGKHTIGKFKIETMTGFDTSKILPSDVLAAVQSESPTEKQMAAVWDYVYQTDESTAALWREIRTLKRKAPALPTLNVRVMGSAKRITKVLNRGDFLQPQQEVSPDVLSVLTATHPFESKEINQGKNRLAFAKWLLNPDHPLTSRVAVNQVWAQLFGKGIVASQNDFGVRGELPTHPELLDWLAWNFSREMNWSRKKLIKKIVMSAAYQQSSVYRTDLKEMDPTNRLLARQNRFRMPAESVRDLYLAASGLLSRKVGGPSVFPPLPAGITDLSYANNFKWNTSAEEDRYRRGLYTFFKRTSPHPNLIAFDCPDSNTSRIERDRSNTPIQALITLNNEVYFESAQALARRVLTSESKVDSINDSARIRFAIRLCISRVPSASEVHRFEKLLAANRKFYKTHPEMAKVIVTRHGVKEVDSVENAAWIATLRIIMNLDEFIVRD